MTSLRDVVLLGVATHKLARIISKDAGASPIFSAVTVADGLQFAYSALEKAAE